MLILSTGLGAWDTIARDTAGTHGVTFPLAIVHAAIEEAGHTAPVCAEGPGAPEPGDIRPQLIMISTLDSRHFWRIPQFLRRWGIPVWSRDRDSTHPIVIMGGQAAYAPAPVEDMVDIVYVGEAEAGIGALLEALGTGTRSQRIEAAAVLPNCVVRTVQPEGHQVRAIYADDIGISLRRRLDVNLRTIHRMEIARGCKGPSKSSSAKGTAACGFCCLGWRAPYRESSAEAVSAALAASADDNVHEIHIAAGDVEGHSGIRQIRSSVSDLGIRDYGWMGRLDTLNDCSVSAGKIFAVGVEGASHRLRRAIGKPALTDDYIVQSVTDYWASGGRRMMMHFIGGLPTETDDDAAQLATLFRRLSAATGAVERHLEIGRQPFGPLPHTPMQWCAPGLSTERIGRVFTAAERLPGLRLKLKSGQRYTSALIAALTMRGGRELGQLLADGEPRGIHRSPRPRAALARALSGYQIDLEHYLSEWDPMEPTPWDHILVHWSREQQRRAHGAIMRRLRQRPV